LLSLRGNGATIQLTPLRPQHFSRRQPLKPLWLYVLFFLSTLAAAAQTPQHKSSTHNQRELTERSIRFSFDIVDLTTNHQFKGQKNSFHVSYEYSGVLKGGTFDTQGHKVSAETFPYFQSVRNEIVGFVQKYSDVDDFYELFGEDICEDILESFPQIRRIELTIDVPAFAEVNVDRRVTVVLSRRSSQKASGTAANR
jgi:hypothetical protein